MISLMAPALRLFLLLTVLLGVGYPFLVTEVSQRLMPFQAQGSLLPVLPAKGVTMGAHASTADAIALPSKTLVQGSVLIGQAFSGPRYFWGRVSATSPVAYNAAASSGSNLGPTNPALAKAVKDRIAALRASSPAQTSALPVDLVTASGSGLDPHISPAAAEWQVSRVADARGLSVAQVRAQVSAATEARQWGILGEPRVNVLLLNRGLDVLSLGNNSQIRSEHDH